MSCFICPRDSRKRSRACQWKESHALWTHLEVMSCQALEKKILTRVAFISTIYLQIRFIGMPIHLAQIDGTNIQVQDSKIYFKNRNDSFFVTSKFHFLFFISTVQVVRISIIISALFVLRKTTSHYSSNVTPVNLNYVVKLTHQLLTINKLHAY